MGRKPGRKRGGGCTGGGKRGGGKQDSQGGGRCRGSRIPKGVGDVGEAGFPRWWEVGKIGKNYTTLCNNLQSKSQRGGSLQK